jgi:hypothetical protein
MTDLAPRPRTATELVDAAFQVYRRDPMHFLFVTAMAYVPWLIIRLVFRIGIDPNELTVSSWMVLGLGSLLVYGIVSGAVTRVAHDVYLSETSDPAVALRDIMARLPALILATLGKLVVVVLAAVFLILPALYPLAAYFATSQAVVLERLGAADSLKRSSGLSKGLKGHILKTILLLFIINIAVTFGTGFPIAMIGNHVVDQVVSTAVTILVYPLFGITETLLYYDARIRKEGFDVELLAAMPAQDARPAGASF